MHTCHNYYYYYYAIDPNFGKHMQAPSHYVNTHTHTFNNRRGTTTSRAHSRCPYTNSTQFAYKWPQSSTHMPDTHTRTLTHTRSITRVQLLSSRCAAMQTSVLKPTHVHNNNMYSMRHACLCMLGRRRRRRWIPSTITRYRHVRPLMRIRIEMRV